MCTEMWNLTEAQFTYLQKILKCFPQNPPRPVQKTVTESRLVSNSSEPIFRIIYKVYEELQNINVYCPRIGASGRHIYCT